jgi:hypothetical protein
MTLVTLATLVTLITKSIQGWEYCGYLEVVTAKS